MCHLPHRLRTWAGAGEPLTNFPVVRDLVVDIEDFMEKLPRVKPWIIRDDEKSVIDGEYVQTPEELEEYKQFSNCINCMLCYAACPIYGIDGPSSAQPPSPSLSGTTWTRDRGQRERLDVLIERKACGDAHSSVNAPGYAPSTSTRQVPSSDTSSRPPRRT